MVFLENHKEDPHRPVKVSNLMMVREKNLFFDVRNRNKGVKTPIWFENDNPDQKTINLSMLSIFQRFILLELPDPLKQYNCLL